MYRIVEESFPSDIVIQDDYETYDEARETILLIEEDNKDKIFYIEPYKPKSLRYTV